MSTDNINLEFVEGIVNDGEEGEPVIIPESLAWVFEGFVPWDPEAADEAEAEDISAEVVRWTKYERLDQVHNSDPSKREAGVLPVNLGGGISLAAVVEPVDGRIGIVMRRLVEKLPLEGGKTFNVYDIVATRPMDSAEDARRLVSEVRKAYQRRITSKVTGFGITREERIANDEIADKASTPAAKASAAFGK